MDYNKIEDTVMKKAMDVFKESAVNFSGINTKIIAPAETEINNIEIKTRHTDYLFYTEDGNYLHFEFQTTDKKEDIKRFLYYDASLFYKEKRKVRTIVIYSSDITEVGDCVDAGTIKYSIEPFYFKNLDGDEISKSKFKEIFSMNEIGRMIRDEGIQEGMQKGIEEGMRKGIKEGELKGKAEGKTEILIKLLTKKFKKIPKEYIEKIEELPESTIDVIATEIFDIETIEDVGKYLS